MAPGPLPPGNRLGIRRRQALQTAGLGHRVHRAHLPRHTLPDTPRRRRPTNNQEGARVRGKMLRLKRIIENLMKRLGEGLIKYVRLTIRMLAVFMGLITVGLNLEGSLSSQSIDPEYIGIMMTVSTFLFTMFFTHTKAEPDQTMKFKVSYMISWFVFFITIFFLLMSVLSEFAGNLFVFLYATLSVVINLELYFTYYYFE